MKTLPPKIVEVESEVKPEMRVNARFSDAFERSSCTQTSEYTYKRHVTRSIPGKRTVPSFISMLVCYTCVCISFFCHFAEIVSFRAFLTFLKDDNLSTCSEINIFTMQYTCPFVVEFIQLNCKNANQLNKTCLYFFRTSNLKKEFKIPLSDFPSYKMKILLHL